MRALAACLLLVGAGPLLAACGRDEQAAPAAPAHATAAPAPIGTAPPPSARPPDPGEVTAGTPDCVAIWNEQEDRPAPRFPAVQIDLTRSTLDGSSVPVCRYAFHDDERAQSFFAFLAPLGVEWPVDQGLVSDVTPEVAAAFAPGQEHAVAPDGAILPQPPEVGHGASSDCVAIWNARVGGGSEPWPYPRVQVAVYVATQGYGCAYRFYDARRFAVWSALLTPTGPVWPPDQGHGGRLTPQALAGFERWRDGAVDRRGAIHGVVASVPDEASTLPVGTHLTPDRAGDPARPALAGTDELPVPVWRYPAARDGLAALIVGTVRVDRATGCVTLDGHPTLWPTGTWVTPRPLVVHLPGRVAVRPGDRIEGGGGEGPAGWARSLAEPSIDGRTDALDCLDAGGSVTALNAAGEVRATHRPR